MRGKQPKFMTIVFLKDDAQKFPYDVSIGCPFAIHSIYHKDCQKCTCFGRSKTEIC